MVNHGILSTLTVIISALLYGVYFSVIAGLVSLFFDLIKIPFFGFTAKKQGCMTDKKVDVAQSSSEWKSPIYTAFGILIFGIGFSIFSYATLDGNLRLYPLLLSIFSFRIVDKFVISKLHVMILGYAYKICFGMWKLLEKAVRETKKKAMLRKSTKNAQINGHRPP